MCVCMYILHYSCQYIFLYIVCSPTCQNILCLCKLLSIAKFLQRFSKLQCIHSIPKLVFIFLNFIFYCIYVFLTNSFCFAGFTSLF